MRTVRKYLGVYEHFVMTCFAEAMTYRAHFVLLISMNFLFTLTSIGAVGFIFDHVDHVGPWDRSTFLFFVSFMLVVDHFHMSFFAESFWQFSDDLKRGMVDFILLRPIGGPFIIFFRHIRPGAILSSILSVIFLIHYGMEIGLSPVKWLILPFLVGLSLTLLVSLEILISMSMFWIVESFGINFLRMQFQQLSRWPNFVYQFWIQKIFIFFFPVLLVGSAPVRFLVDFGDWELLSYFVIALPMTWLFIHLFWKLGLRYYESASS